MLEADVRFWVRRNAPGSVSMSQNIVVPVMAADAADIKIEMYAGADTSLVLIRATSCRMSLRARRVRKWEQANAADAHSPGDRLEEELAALGTHHLLQRG